MDTAFVEDRLIDLWETPKTLRGWFATVDHKELGIRYLVTAFVFLLIGGVEALLMRIQLSRPNMAFLSPEAYNQIFTMHGATMIFWYASPILSGFAVYLVPLMIGARDMAFPRLNAFTYWSYLFSGIFLYIAPVAGAGAACRMVCLCAVHADAYSPGDRHGHLRARADFSDDLNHGRRDQLHRHDPAAARAGHGDQPHAPVSVQHADDLLCNPVCAARADCRVHFP